MDDDEQTYCITRYYRDSSHPGHRMTVEEGLTLEEAQEHCQDPATREDGVWFDGYNKE